MTNTEIIQAIRNEIERLKTVQLKRIQEGDLVDAEPYDKNEAYNGILSLLDTLESEKPMNQKGLEREIERCLWKLSDDPSNEELRMFARNFYDLGCRHTAEKYDEIEYNRQRAEESVCKDLEKEIDFQTFSKEMGAVFALPKERTKNTEEEPLRWEYEIARHFAQWGAKHLADDSKTSPNDLEEAARHSEILTYPMPEDGDIEKVFKVQEARVFHEIGFIAGAKWQKEQDEKEQADLLYLDSH